MRRGLDRMEEILVGSGDFRFLDSAPGDIYSFATPFFLPEAQHLRIRDWVGKVVAAVESLGLRLRQDAAMAREHLLLDSPLEREIFSTDPGFGEMLPIHRLDLVLAENAPPNLLEVNCGCPGGELDPARVAEAFAGSRMRLDLVGGGFEGSTEAVEFFDPRDESLEILLRCYGVFRKARPALPEIPTIALVTSSAQAHFMVPECRGIAAHYRKRGYTTVVGDLLELEAQSDEVLLRGDPVHLIFRKFSTESFRRRMEDRDRFGPQTCLRVRKIWEAVARRQVCMVNPVGSTWLQDKGLLEPLRAKHPELQEVVCETYVLRPEFPALNPTIWQAACSGHEFVLKRRHSFGGRHVILDPELVKSRAPQIIQEEPSRWVAQRRVPVPTYPFAIRDRTGSKIGRFPHTFSSFGRSCFVRVGTGGPYDPVNAHAEGAATCAFVLG
jgi:hypothetical protein